MRLFRVFLCLLCLILPLSAQEQRCDRTTSITVAAGSTATVAVAIAGQRIYVCGWMLTGNTAVTGIQFVSGSTNLTGVMLTPVTGNLTMPVTGSFVLAGNDGAAVTVAATTGAVTGFVRFTQQ